MKALKERDIVWFMGGFCGASLLGILALAFVLSLAGCAASRPAVTLGPQLEAMPDSLPILPHLLQRQVQRLDSAALAGWLPRDYANLPVYLVPPPAGSTPRQRRQWQKAQVQNLARAGVLPAKVKNSSVATAPGAVAITRPTSAVATAPGAVATDVRKAGSRGGSAAVGSGAVVTSERAGASWYWYLVAAVIGAAGWEVLTSQVTPLRLLLRWRKAVH
jgi:hypothetical protein